MLARQLLAIGGCVGACLASPIVGSSDGGSGSGSGTRVINGRSSHLRLRQGQSAAGRRSGAPSVPEWSTIYDMDYLTNGTGTTHFTNLLCERHHATSFLHTLGRTVRA
jgi:hypothetical protein